MADPWQMFQQFQNSSNPGMANSPQFQPWSSLPTPQAQAPGWQLDLQKYLQSPQGQQPGIPGTPSGLPGTPDGIPGAATPAGPGALDYAKVGIQGGKMLGDLWMAWQSMQAGQEAFDFQKSMAQGNMANSIQAYNTQMSDRIKGRYSAREKSPEQVQAEIDAAKLKA